MKLLLFDIDGTLIDAAGAGMVALQAGANDVFGSAGPPLDLAGSTDEGVVRGMLDHFGIEPSQEKFDEFYAAYLVHLRRGLAADGYAGRTLDGAAELVKALAERSDDYALGLLTGNIADGAWEKVAAHGLKDYFQFGAWGSDHWDRNKLGAIALARAEEAYGRTFQPSDTVIIGDTPKDIACARACGANVIAVATGSFSADELRAADLVVENLRNAIPIIAFIDSL